uniref:ADP-ribosylhydrolase ARH3 n=1 Tax=Parascaris univalens TaxID=6257 RepID=A0A914ZRF9_PARUN
MSIKKAIGCLYGQLIGDALGCRYEFKCAADTQAMIAKDLDDEKFLAILGGGPFKLSPGQVTDDSEMAFSLASSLCRCKRFDAADVACAYVRWEQSAPPDIGIATHYALNIEKRLSENWMEELDVEAKKDVYKMVLSNVRQHNGGRLSNGCLMRISPLAIASVNFSIERMKEVVQAECRLTHHEAVCVDATTSYVAAVRSLISEHAPEEAYEMAMEICHSETVKDILKCSKNEPIPVKAKGTLIKGDTAMMGYIGVALQSAFYEMLHASSFYNGVLSAIARGGDTDTNGAIVAAILGARFGVDEIPAAWLTTIRSAKPRCPSLRLSYNVEEIVPQLLEVS